MGKVIIIVIVVSVVIFLVVIGLVIAYNIKKNISKSDFDVKINFLSDKEIAGINGERKVNFVLNRLIEDDEYLLSGLLIPRNIDGAEIDSVLITRKGIFCIETKNWSGTIFGSDTNTKWSQMKPNYTTATHNNPVTQNKRHCDLIKKLFNNKYKPYNIVIFSNENCTLDVDVDNACTLNEFIDYYRNSKDSDNELSINDINYIHNKLQNYVATKDELRRHKEYLKRKYNH